MMIFKIFYAPMPRVFYFLLFAVFLSCSEEEPTSEPVTKNNFIISSERFAPTTTRTYVFSAEQVGSSSSKIKTYDLSVGPESPTNSIGVLTASIGAFATSIGALTTSIEASTTSIFYNWNMGDGTEYNSCCIQHTYAESGIYLVKLTITQNDEVIQIEREIRVGEQTEDVINGYNNRPKLYRRVLKNEQGQKVCLAPESDPCQDYPEICCSDDNIFSFSSEEIINYQNTYNDCICLDVDGNPVQDIVYENVDWYFNGDIDTDRTTRIIDDGEFKIFRGNGWSETYSVIYDCEAMNELAQQDLVLSTSDKPCDCGFFTMVKNEGTKHIVTYLSKKVDNEVIESIRLELDPGETKNLDCSKVCLENEKEVVIEFNCTEYYTPIF